LGSGSFDRQRKRFQQIGSIDEKKSYHACRGYDVQARYQRANELEASGSAPLRLRVFA
jgi:hypothetical protein